MASNDEHEHESDDKRTRGVRMRRYIDVVVEDRLSAMLFRGAIADISETGMRVIADQYLPKGSRYVFTMKRAPNLELRGEIRWVKSSDGETFQVGVFFVDVDPEVHKRLVSFLEIERQRLTSS